MTPTTARRVTLGRYNLCPNAKSQILRKCLQLDENYSRDVSPWLTQFYAQNLTELAWVELDSKIVGSLVEGFRNGFNIIIY